VAVAPYIQGYVMVEKDNRVTTPMFRAIDPVAEGKVNDLEKFIKDGKYDLKGDSAIIGSILAKPYLLGAQIGDKISVISPRTVEGIADELQREQDDPKAKPKTFKDFKEEGVLPEDLTITGIFESGRYEYDSGVLLVPLNVGQELYELGDSVQGLSVRTTDQGTADRVADQLNTALNTEEFRGVHAVAWMNGDDKNRIGAIKFEHNIMFIILMFLVIIAAFCVMNTLITVTVQKRREIGIMKALGANVRQIVWVFLAQGMVVGLFGNIIGLTLGLTLVAFRNEFRTFLEHLLHIEIFSQDIYEFSQIPARVQPGEMTLICISAFVICSVAALIPAWFAARLDPVKALRYE
jgi:lipoprotein-releasing system permease protein